VIFQNFHRSFYWHNICRQMAGLGKAQPTMALGWLG
jgi:hypothetical protein